MNEHEEKARDIVRRWLGSTYSDSSRIALAFAKALDEAVKAERLAGLQSRITFMEVHIEVLKDEIAAIALPDPSPPPSPSPPAAPEE